MNHRKSTPKDGKRQVKHARLEVVTWIIVYTSMTNIDSRGPNHGILKKDARGRVHTSVRQREAILDEFERSGLSGPKFSQVAECVTKPSPGGCQR